MIQIRPAQDRGHANFGWLDSHHSFSFGRYYDPRHMGVSNLRVINDDTVLGRAGFDTHGHSDMEIVSYVLEGALVHRDSMGHGTLIKPGEVQRMSAGTGVEHSEFNYSESEPVHFLQIWLRPNQLGVEPSYEQKQFPYTERQGRLQLIVSPDGRDGSLRSNQDALLYSGVFASGQTASHQLAGDRPGYVHLARGEAMLNGQPLQAGDGARIDAGARIELQGSDDAEVLLFDLPPEQ
ncbi:MAG: pirin family protein [Gammaproteobacteria bacterium]|nr:pirin family protein [Gammaproteobacteria bacterium]